MLAIWDLINEHGLAEFVVAFSFDTTNTNSGDKRGACVLLDKNFSRRILNLACRHHVYEIFMSAAFQKILGNSGNKFLLYSLRLLLPAEKLKFIYFSHFAYYIALYF